MRSMRGRSTFTATTRPSCSSARCTTAIDARPMGSSSKRRNASASGRPRVDSTTARTCANGTAGPVSRHERNSSAAASPNTPGAEATSCPNFTYVAPSASNVRRSGRAKASPGTGRPTSRRSPMPPNSRAITRSVRRLRRASARRPGSGRTIGCADGTRGTMDDPRELYYSGAHAGQPMSVILHADMDAFYAAIEQRDRPELRGRPVIVGGTSTRGVVMAASYEARPFGVRSAMPTVQARALCPDAVFLAGDMAKYRRVSTQVRRVFETVSPLVEPLSLDEAFIDVTASIRLLGPPLAIGRLLKDRVRAATGLVVSVGIGPGKMVAKIASDVGKPDGLVEVDAERVDAFLRPLPVGRLWGVGPV